MAQLTVPKAPTEYATHYRELLGVDFQSDQTEVDRRRSPDMVNMISDFGGNPIKRDGYREVSSQAFNSLVQVGESSYAIYQVQAGTQIAEVAINGYDLDKTVLYTAPFDIGDIGAVFTHKRTIYIVGKKCLLAFDTETGTASYTGTGTGMMSTNTVGESAPVNPDIVPDVLINVNPDGTGGYALDDKNIMSIYQRISYKGDGTTTVYKIPTCDSIGDWVYAEVLNTSGEWVEVTASAGNGAVAIYTGTTLDGESTANTTIASAYVTFQSAPRTATAGQDNVRITFAPFSMEKVSTSVYKGFYNEQFVKLLSCQAATIQNNRMFVADNYKIYYSDVSQPLIVSDLAWFEVDGEVTGFTRKDNYLAVLTKDTGKSTIYLASEQLRTVDSTTGATEAYFTVKESNAGISAIAPKCIATLSDEPLFLSSTGIYGMLSNYLSDKYAVNRSARINKKLCQEPNLDKAVGIAFNDYFYLAVNGHMYVLDGRHKESDRAGNKLFEAYYFEGLPAIENMFVVGDRMFFTDSSKTYTWNNDLNESERYLDNAHISEGGLVGTPVCARWCSVFDDDGAPQRLKTLMKKGSMVTLVPQYHSGCEITLIKDGEQFEYLGSFDGSMLSFESIDFTQFSFNSNSVAFDNFTKKKVKKYKRLQIRVENNKAEPFALTQITKTYTFGNYAKR